MIAIKWGAIKKIPESCVDCIYFATRPDPFDGWRDFCEINSKTIEDPDERAEHCLLIEVAEKLNDGAKND